MSGPNGVSEDIGRAIREELTRSGTTLRSFAGRAGISYDSVKAMMFGQRVPTTKEATAMEKVFPNLGHVLTPAGRPGEEAARGAPSTTLETVTPELAKQYLERNTNNRRISEAHVDSLARSLTAKEWRHTHQGIAFSVSDALLDGQHRLRAIIKAGIPAQMLVTRGLPEDALDAIDTGRIRSIGNVLDLSHGIGKSEKVVSVVSVIMNACGYTYSRKSPNEIMRWYGLIGQADVDWSIHKIDKTLQAGPYRAAFALARPADPASIESFARQVASRTNMADGSPAHTLDRLITLYRGSRGAASNRHELFLKVLGCLRAHLLGVSQHSRAYSAESTFDYWLKVRKTVGCEDLPRRNYED